MLSTGPFARLKPYDKHLLISFAWSIPQFMDPSFFPSLRRGKKLGHTTYGKDRARLISGTCLHSLFGRFGSLASHLQLGIFLNWTKI